jgi:hypothetical protein
MVHQESKLILLIRFVLSLSVSGCGLVFCFLSPGFPSPVAVITFLKRGPADPSQQCKRASNSIQDPPPRWIFTIFKLKCGGGNLFSPAMTSTIERNHFVRSLLEPLLKKVTPVVGSRMLWSRLGAGCIFHCNERFLSFVSTKKKKKT